MEKKKKKKMLLSKQKKEDSFNIRKIYGYTIYTQNNILNEKITKCNCFKLYCRTVDNCIMDSGRSILTFCPCKDCIEEEKV